MHFWPFFVSSLPKNIKTQIKDKIKQNAHLTTNGLRKELFATYTKHCWSQKRLFARPI